MRRLCKGDAIRFSADGVFYSGVITGFYTEGNRRFMRIDTGEAEIWWSMTARGEDAVPHPRKELSHDTANR